MTIARRKQLRLDVTPFYHCITRCVRRAFLCGKDRETGRTFEHRKGWIEKHLLLLSEVFCIDVAGYTVMSNHYHLVLHVDQAQALALSDEQVLNRWLSLYRGPVLVQRYINEETLTKEETDTIRKTIDMWREELTNISRFMGHLNQTISRRANREDDCRGRFWESRFKLQAILDLKALLRTLCYVDLNPIRAGTSNLPEKSPYTSVNRRLKYAKSGLMKFGKHTTERKLLGSHQTIPIGFDDYLALLDYTGREISEGKSGSISPQTPPILDRVGYGSKAWSDEQKSASRWFSKALGGPEAIAHYCKAVGQRWIWSAS